MKNVFGIELSGRYIAKLYDEAGYLKQEVYGKNVVVTNGKEFLASFLKSAAAAASTFTMRYVAIGSGTNTESGSDTAMQSELARVSAVVSYVSGQIYQLTATFAAGVGTGSVYEYGVLSSSTNGTMLSHDTEALITKGASDTLTVTYQLTIS